LTKFIFILLLLFITINLSYSAEEIKKLTLENIISISLENNLQIKSAKERLASTEAIADGSGKWPNPEFLIGPNIGDINTNDSSVILSQVFDITGKYSLKRKKADLNVLYELSNLQEICLNISLQVKLNYYDYICAMEQLKIQEKNSEIFSKVIEKAQIQYDLGNIPQADLLRLQLEKSKIELTRLHAENQVKISKSVLLNTMGIKDENIEISVFDIKKDISFSEETKFDNLFSLALENRPVIKGQKALILAKDYEIKIAKSERYPDLIISYKRDTLEHSSPNGGEVRLAMPLWDYGSISSQADSAEASRKEEEVNMEIIKSQIKIEVGAAFYELTETIYMLGEFKKNILVNSDELLWKAQFGYEEGAFSYLAFMDSMRTYNEVQIEYIKTLYKYYEALARCERVTGTKIKGAY